MPEISDICRHPPQRESVEPVGDAAARSPDSSVGKPGEVTETVRGRDRKPTGVAPDRACVSRRKPAKPPRSRRADMRKLRPAAEIFLSYLTGLGPVGEPIEPHLAWAMADLGYRQKVSIYRCLGDLIASGCVSKLAPGSGGTIGLIVVDVRLEQIERVRCAGREPGDAEEMVAPSGAGRVRAGRVTPQEWAERVAEIPDDTRGLTARFFGDPIPGDQRRRGSNRLSTRPVCLQRSSPAGDQAGPERRASG
jgi:hypothetical protein